VRSIRCIGVLMAHRESDPEFQDYLEAFRQGLQRFGWVEGRNIRIETRWGALDDAEVRQRSAEEILALNLVSFGSKGELASCPRLIRLSLNLRHSPN
jgi:hypothetical protein